MGRRSRPLAHDDCGVTLYGPTAKVTSYRLVWTDPLSSRRHNRRYATREMADEGFATAVDYVRTARTAAGPPKARRNGPPTVDDLFEEVQRRWEQKRNTRRYIEKRQGTYRKWIQPDCGKLTLHDWGSSDQHCVDVLASAERAGLKPSTVQTIGALLRYMVSVAHKARMLPRTSQPMEDVEYVARRIADDESANYVPPSERPTTDMVVSLALAFDARGQKDGRPWLGQMPEVAGFGGLRFGELTSLRPVDVDSARRAVMVESAWTYSAAAGAERKSPKNGRRRSVQLPKTVFDKVLARAKEVEAEDGSHALLYPSPKGPFEPYTEGQFRRLFEAAARDAGWACEPDTVSPKGKRQRGRPVLPFKNLRHHAATWLHEVAGFDWVDVSRTLGHASVAFTQARYVRPAADAEARNRASLDRL